MKKKLVYLCCIFLIVGAVSAGAVGLAGNGVVGKDAGKSDTSGDVSEEFLVVTSFYPVYLLTCNLADGVPGVTVRNLTESHAGCIHDYQLTTEDMRLLSEADLFILNGGGMEAFIEQAAGLRADLTMAEASEGISFTDTASEHSHDHEEHDHAQAGGEDGAQSGVSGNGENPEMEHSHSEEGNAHVWTDPERYLMQLSNVTEALCEADPANEERYRENAKRYGDEVQQVEAELVQLRERAEGVPVVLFHDAFVYLADTLGMEILHTASLDEDTTISAGELAEMIEEMRYHGGYMIWEENDVNNPAGERLAEEVEGHIYELNPLTSGTSGASLSAYIDGMRQNIAVIKEALTDAGY